MVRKSPSRWFTPTCQRQSWYLAHPEWKTQFVELGKHFEADYIFNVELDALNLYAPRSFQQVMQGRCRVTLSIADVAKDEEPVKRWDLSPGPFVLALARTKASSGKPGSPERCSARARLVPD